jgi:hypothetical protein
MQNTCNGMISAEDWLVYSESLSACLLTYLKQAWEATPREVFEVRLESFISDLSFV